MLVNAIRRWGTALEAGADTFRGVVEQVLEAVLVLARHRLAGRARREPVRRTFDDDELLVAAGRGLVMDFAVADEVMRAHRGDERRGRDLRHGAARGIVARAPVDVVHRILGADRVGAEARPARPE